ncbi:pentapeptide repeat-containing protein, partial [Amycolatopsis sp. NPDC059657]|uniref:pentapeptide repeat-containing protein n=1 Tax=Amycolatopsis sp. NPDC059657 TaxID=3346899 RepID=UPI003671683F
MVATLVVVAMVGVLVVLWRWIDGLALADVEKKAAAQLDAVKVAASIAVGGGGLFALYLAARRQRTQEMELDARHAELHHREAELAQRDRVQAHAEEISEINRVHAERVAAASEQDAVERRITDLYTKSVEQLGSDKAPVRLGGLYALERLAQTNPEQRSTVVNVLCAYLRMPYTPATESPDEHADEMTRALHAERVQERQVRLTAQRILAAHTYSGEDPHNPTAAYWPETELDLAGAVLIDLDLTGCRLGVAQFDRATFIGNTIFTEATFDGSGEFFEATFNGHAYFRETKFTKDANFLGAMFAKDAIFVEANFAGNAFFSGSTFAGESNFEKANFDENSYLVGIKFAWDANFDRATFVGKSHLNEATVGGHAYFAETTFMTDVTFRGTAITGQAYFNGVQFAGDADFDEAMLAGSAFFKHSTFERNAYFNGTAINGKVNFSDALAAHLPASRSVWPSGWHLVALDEIVENRDGTWHRIVQLQA